ncbi:MAG: hypothetical protein PHQ25_01905 [Acidobacteriota bacterium]|nr:hypothetical protein [Acidobacteriota bacterium]MDW3229891.1 hypothetical protein [Acidobacteriota bacterium]MDY0232121.1 hypothetical protein [Candidatus Saccharicenans sp.]
MIESEERHDLSPICPHCSTALTKILYQQLKSTFGRRYVYFCPHCHKILGVSHRKGFWMG